MATSKARAYYSLVSRLRRSELPFSSGLPDSDMGDCDLVLTTASESERFGERAIALENLDENPGVFKGQVVSRLGREEDLIRVGVDPGKRTGLAVFYGRTRLAFGTFDSSTAVCSRARAFARGMPGSRMLVRIGNGNKRLAARLVEGFEKAIPTATVELVDESGTSVRTSEMKGVRRDEASAAKIAFRKGEVVFGHPRIHG